MRVRAVLPVVGVPMLAALMLGCTQAEAPPALTLPSPYFATAPAPDGAVYRSFYYGAVKGYETSTVRWLDDGDGLEVSVGGSQRCPSVPTAVEVLAPDRLRIRTERVVLGGCVEDYQYWTFVLDPPQGLDATIAADVIVVDQDLVDKGVVDEDSVIGAELLTPLPCGADGLPDCGVPAGTEGPRTPSADSFEPGGDRPRSPAPAH